MLPHYSALLNCFVFSKLVISQTSDLLLESILNESIYNQSHFSLKSVELMCEKARLPAI